MHKKLFEYEEENDIPANERLTTYDGNTNIPEISEFSPENKSCVDIRTIKSRVKNL